MNLDDTDFRILQAIKDLRVSIPNVEKIYELVNIDPKELGARLGVLDSQGYVKVERGSGGYPSGIHAARLTDRGKLILIKRTDVLSLDDTDFRILQAIMDLRVSIPNVEKIYELVNIDPAELGARLGVLDFQGYVKVERGSGGYPSGIHAACLTDKGKLAAIKRSKS